MHKQTRENESRVKPMTSRESFLIGADAMRIKRDDIGAYLPSLEEIAAECERFQASWTDVEREKRRRGWQPE